jgi:hypothetical protein
MKRKIINIAIWSFFLPVAGWAQQKEKPRTSRWLDITGTVGSSQGSVAGAYVHNWKVGKRHRWELGTGLRVTNYFGTKKDFITAGPAKYTRSFTTPFLIFFAGQNEGNFDTLQVQRPLTSSVNITVNIGYSIAPKWYAGFNIDVIGFTFGRKTGGVFTGKNNNGQQGVFSDNNVKPTAFNALLTGDHDKGSLNSEFFLRYKFNDRWGIKGVYQFVFIEYETSSLKQSIPGGPLNNRFRNKANNLGVGITYHL